MANKRIKDLSTTAAVTASDDFIAVDGTTNGTRKLSAYSPTFGGNLTVSGGTARFQDPTNSYGVTITTAAAKTLVETLFGGSSLGIRVGGSGSDSLTIASTGATIRDNLTVSGTGTSSVAGNWLVGTTTDSANGKLQLATHTTSAGGIGFGTDTSLYRSASGNLNLYGSGTDAKLLFSHSSSTAGKGFEIQLDSSKDLYIWQRENRAMYFGTNATTALTLDSSQRTILSGALRLNNAYTASAVVPTGYVTIQDSTGTTYKVCVLL